MATIPDVQLNNNEYQDLYVLTGIPTGTSVTVQNKSTSSILLQNTASRPNSTSSDGYLLMSLSVVTVAGTIDGLWARGSGKVHVEVVT